MKQICEVQQAVNNLGLDFVYLNKKLVEKYNKDSESEFYSDIYKGAGWYNSAGTKFSKKAIKGIIE